MHDKGFFYFLSIVCYFILLLLLFNSNSFPVSQLFFTKVTQNASKIPEKAVNLR